ncbi:MAG: hypothetical protein MHM6MM_000725 [Cercozoa sp. M6MM]
MHRQLLLSVARLRTQLRQSSILTTRNVGVVAHVDAGKTTTTEAALYLAGTTDTAGNVDSGDTVTDFLDEEKERGITIQSAAVSFPWAGRQVNLIDTPGHVDFTVEVERAMRVLDGAVVVLDCCGGVEAQSETVWKQARAHGVPAVCFVNKLDKDGAAERYSITLEQIQTKLRTTPLPLQMPVFRKGLWVPDIVVDLVNMCVLEYQEGSDDEWTQREFSALPSEEQEQAQEARHELLEALSDLNDEIAELFLMEEEVPTELLLETVKTATQDAVAMPVVVGAALRGKGVRALLDTATQFLPSPSERSKYVPAKARRMHYKGTKQTGTLTVQKKESDVIHPDADSDLVALAFKVRQDPHLGNVAFIRVYGGKLEPRQKIVNVRTMEELGPTKWAELPTRLFRIQGGEMRPVECAAAGDIVALAGCNSLRTGDTFVRADQLAGDTKDVPNVPLLEGVQVPAPVFTASLLPQRGTQLKDLHSALDAMCAEDPSLRWEHDAVAESHALSGMGELHLEIAHSRLSASIKGQVDMGDMQVQYQEVPSHSETTNVAVRTSVGGNDIAFSFTFKVDRLEHSVEGRNLCTAAPDVAKTSNFFATQDFYIKFCQDLAERAERSGFISGHRLAQCSLRLTGCHVLEGSTSTALSEERRVLLAWKTLRKLQKGSSLTWEVQEPLMRVAVSVPSFAIAAVMRDLTVPRYILDTTCYFVGRYLPCRPTGGHILLTASST